MVYHNIFIMIMSAFFLQCSNPSTFTPQPNQFLDGKASYVIDGDTFYFSFDQGKFKTRLNGINAPDISEPKGREAFEFLRSLAHQKNVRIEYLSKDTDGRWIVNATLSTGEDIPTAIVTHGWAKSADPKFSTLENQAREKGLGIWALPH